MMNKSKLAKGVTCSMDELDDLFNPEEPNDESYHDNTNEFRQDQNQTYNYENIKKFVEHLEMKLQMTLLRKISFNIVP